MRLNVTDLTRNHVEQVLATLRRPEILDALALVRCPELEGLLQGRATTKFGSDESIEQVRWWVVEADGAARWCAIEYGWRGALDSSRELDLFSLTDAPSVQDDFLWVLWSLVRTVMQRRQTRRLRWQVSQKLGKSSLYNRLEVHALGEFELEGGVREVFELSRKRFEAVEKALGVGEGRRALLSAWRATLI